MIHDKIENVGLYLPPSIRKKVEDYLADVCKYKNDDSGRLDYDHLYYLPDLKTPRLERVTRCLYIKGENLLHPNTLDSRKAFKNCGFPEEILSTSPHFYTLKQEKQSAVNRAIKDLETTIDLLFDTEEIQSWEHLRKRLKSHYLSRKPRTTKGRK